MQAFVRLGCPLEFNNHNISVPKSLKLCRSGHDQSIWIRVVGNHLHLSQVQSKSWIYFGDLVFVKWSQCTILNCMSLCLLQGEENMIKDAGGEEGPPLGSRLQWLFFQSLPLLGQRAAVDAKARQRAHTWSAAIFVLLFTLWFFQQFHLQLHRPWASPSAAKWSWFSGQMQWVWKPRQGQSWLTFYPTATECAETQLGLLAWPCIMFDPSQLLDKRSQQYGWMLSS